MDPVNQFRSVVMVMAMLLFLGIVAWTFSGRNRRAFDEAAALPFEDEATQPSTSPASQGFQGATHE